MGRMGRELVALQLCSSGKEMETYSMMTLRLLLLPAHLFCMSTGFVAEDKFLSKTYSSRVQDGVGRQLRTQAISKQCDKCSPYSPQIRLGWFEKEHSQQVNVIRELERWVGFDHDMDIFWGWGGKTDITVKTGHHFQSLEIEEATWHNFSHSIPKPCGK